MVNLKLGISMSVLSIVTSVVALALPWYRIAVARTSGFAVLAPNTSTYYSWNSFEAINNDEGGLSTIKTYHNAGMNNTGQVFQHSLALLIVGLALVVIHLILQLIAFFTKYLRQGKWWKIFAGITGFTSLILIALSVFLLVGLPDNFYEDEVNCPGPEHDQQQMYCNSFYDATTVDDTVVVYTVSWMPWVGWWLSVGAGFFALMSVASSLKTGKR